MATNPYGTYGSAERPYYTSLASLGTLRTPQAKKPPKTFMELYQQGGQTPVVPMVASQTGPAAAQAAPQPAAPAYNPVTRQTSVPQYPAPVTAPASVPAPATTAPAPYAPTSVVVSPPPEPPAVVTQAASIPLPPPVPPTPVVTAPTAYPQQIPVQAAAVAPTSTPWVPKPEIAKMDYFASLKSQMDKLYSGLLGRMPGVGDYEAQASGGPKPGETAVQKATNIRDGILSSQEFNSKFDVSGADPLTQAKAWVRGYIGRDMTSGDQAILTNVFNAAGGGASGLAAVKNAILQSDELKARVNAMFDSRAGGGWTNPVQG